MDINKSLHIFTQLVHNLISCDVREPILEMAAEIEAEVAELTGDLSRADDTISGLRETNSALSTRLNQNARITVNQYHGRAGTATKLIKQLIHNGRVACDGPIIKQAMQEYFKHNSKIVVIKEYRSLTGKGLVEAKKQIDEWIDDWEECLPKQSRPEFPG